MRNHLSTKNRPLNRRVFVVNGLRTIFLGGFSFLGLFLGWKRRANAGSGSSCPVDLVCRSCARISTCQEPLALEERRNTSNIGSCR